MMSRQQKTTVEKKTAHFEELVWIVAACISSNCNTNLCFAPMWKSQQVRSGLRQGKSDRTRS